MVLNTFSFCNPFEGSHNPHPYLEPLCYQNKSVEEQLSCWDKKQVAGFTCLDAKEKNKVVRGKWEVSRTQGGQEGRQCWEKKRSGWCLRGSAANLKPPLNCSSGPVTPSEYPWGTMTSFLRNIDLKQAAFSHFVPIPGSHVNPPDTPSHYPHFRPPPGLSPPPSSVTHSCLENSSDSVCFSLVLQIVSLKLIDPLE